MGWWGERERLRLMGAHLVAPQPVAGVHDEWFPTVVVLADIQAALGALVFDLQGRKQRGKGGRRCCKGRGRDAAGVWALQGTHCCTNTTPVLGAASGSLGLSRT